MKRYSVILVWLVLVSSSARADSWALSPEVKDTEFTFGETRIVLHYDSTDVKGGFPKYALSIHRKDKLVGKHEGVGFEKLFASDDNAYFLGLSNRGLIRQAYVIFDRDGRIVKVQSHDPRQVHYFTMSKTLIRRWCDIENPDVRFQVAEGKLKDVRIRVCDGSRTSLLVREDLRLRTFLLEELLKRHAKPEEICYVSFGTEPAAEKDKTTPCDPPKRLLSRFQGRRYRVMPVSAYPKPKKMEPFPPDNPKTGAPDGIYTVEIVRWLDQTTAEVKAEMYRDGLWARGFDAVVEEKDGRWRIKKRGSTWVS